MSDLIFLGRASTPWASHPSLLHLPSTHPVFLHVIVVDIDQLQRILYLVGTPGPELSMKISSESVSVKKSKPLCSSSATLPPPACVCALFFWPGSRSDLFTTSYALPVCALSLSRICSRALVSTSLEHKTISNLCIWQGILVAQYWVTAPITLQKIVICSWLNAAVQELSPPSFLPVTLLLRPLTRKP